MRILITPALVLLLTACKTKERVDMLVLASKVYTADSQFAEYEAIAIKDGKIVAVGDKSTITNKYSADSTINATGKYIYPGFIDAHCHFSGYALSSYRLDLVGTKSYEEVLAKLVEYDKTNTLDWIYGRGWDQNDWTVKEFPDKKALDSLFPHKPVILKRVDGHAVLCNQKALDMAGITSGIVIVGGIIEKKNGNLTGILIDNAAEPVENIIPSLPPVAEATKYLQAAEQECFSLGLTGIVDCGIKAEVITLLKQLYGQNKLSIANSVLLAQDDSTLKTYAADGFYKNGQFQINGIKLYADGALGSRGACLLKEYHDMPGHVGMLLSDISKMREIAKLAKAHNLQLCTHAIGDSANRAILRLYSEFLPKNNDLRWRIEHAQVVDYQDYKWFSDYKIVPSVQPTHAISDMPWAGDRLGEQRLPAAYAYKKLLEQNGWIALGTDFPVEAINPLATFYTAVARKDKDGHPENGFLPENKLSRKEALLGMTYWAAKSVFWEKEKGSLEPGKDADIIILDKDIMSIAENELLNVNVIYTILNGKTVYKKAGAE
ncbi:MAG: amidohydrolase [Taibaiella sp.]|nr:amidohydrolase [Taibaiella sp.]